MRTLAASALCLLMLTACETTGGRGPPVGLSQMEIEPGRVQVTYRGSSSMSEAEVRDRALLAAADASIARGYDWFRITERYRELAAPTSPRFSFGLGGGGFGRRSAVGVGASTGFGGGASVAVTLEAMGGRGARPADPEVYDARSVSDTLRPRLPPR